MANLQFNISKQNLFHFSKLLIVLAVIIYIQIMYTNDTDVPTYENGQLKSYGAYTNGLPDGKWTWWFENGEKMSEVYFSNGKRNGVSISWFQGGEEMSRGMYKEDKLEGGYFKWHPNGKIAFEGNYLADKLDGLQKYYDSTGILTKTETFSAGVLLSE